MLRRFHFSWILAVIACVAGCERGSLPAPASQPGQVAAVNSVAVVAGVNMDGLDLRVEPARVHQNLALFVIHGATTDDREFLTLDEGLVQGVVTVTEKASGQVNELLLENRSEKPLFLHEGDRVTGGKQDRIVQTSLVIAAKSGPLPIPALCVEPHRWTEGSTGNVFHATTNTALAPKDVRMASKVEGDQSLVWENVARTKAACVKSLSATNTSSSLNETIDGAEAKRVSDEALAALKDAPLGSPDLIGVAFAVNGKVEEVDIYPCGKLLAKLYPRLLASYAIEAANRRNGTKETLVPSPADVVRFLREGQASSTRMQQVNSTNTIGLKDFANKVECETRLDGNPVHRQVIGK